MSLADFTPGGLYVLLYIRSDPPLPRDFHWAIYIHDGKLGGTKYHIRNLGSGWIVDHGSRAQISKEIFLIGGLRIGSVSEDQKADVDKLLRTNDDIINEDPSMTCRVWVLRALQLLRDEKDQLGILKCGDIDDLQEELMAFGNANSASTAANEQPRPVSLSRICKI